MQAEGRKKALIAFPSSFSLAVVADQATKALVRSALPEGGRAVRLIGDFLILKQVRNPGVSFGLFRGGSPAVLIAAAALPVLLLSCYAVFGKGLGSPALVGMGLICGGAVGNIIDRLAFGQVIDFIDLSFWPAFNLADAFVVVGVAFFLAGMAGKAWIHGRKGEQRGS